MAWRVHLANSAIRMIEVFGGARPMLAAWASPRHVSLFDLNDGAPLRETALPPLPTLQAPQELWERYQEEALRLPNGEHITRVQIANRTLLLTRDGAQRLHWDGAASLMLMDDKEAVLLEAAGVSRWLAVDFDRDLGFTAALADDGRLYLYELNVFKGSYDLGLQPEDDRRCHVQIQRGQHIHATDGRTLVAVGANGTVKKRVALHYRVALMASSPDGQQLALVDYEDGIVRLYRGSDLLLTHQKFAIDLVAEAAPRQLLEELPPPMTAVSSLALANQGMIAFAMGGVLCCTHQDALTALPRSPLI
jgi:hypothetical protein